MGWLVFILVAVALVALVAGLDFVLQGIAYGRSRASGPPVDPGQVRRETARDRGGDPGAGGGLLG